MMDCFRTADPMGRAQTNLAKQNHVIIKTFLPGLTLTQLPLPVAKILLSDLVF